MPVKVILLLQVGETRVEVVFKLFWHQDWDQQSSSVSLAQHTLLKLIKERRISPSSRPRREACLQGQKLACLDRGVSMCLTRVVNGVHVYRRLR